VGSSAGVSLAEGDGVWPAGGGEAVDPVGGGSDVESPPMIAPAGESSPVAVAAIEAPSHLADASEGGGEDVADQLRPSVGSAAAAR
jgi:hypothetical protein